MAIMETDGKKRVTKPEEESLAPQLEAGQVIVCHALQKEISRLRLSEICQTIFQLAFLANAQCYAKEASNEYLFLSVFRDGHSAWIFSRSLIQALLPEVRPVRVPPGRAEGFVPWGNIFDQELMVEISAAVNVYEDVPDRGVVELAAAKKSEEASFFFPILDADKHEDAYAIFAKLYGRIVPLPEKRIYSISFIQDGTYWVATVGKSLKGERHPTPRREAGKAEDSQQISDPAVVLVIFEGHPFLVVTNGHRTQWANPFYVASPTSIQYFAPLSAKARAAGHS
jgi:hypothetical protein